MELEQKIGELEDKGQKSVDLDNAYNEAVHQLKTLPSKIRGTDFNLLQMGDVHPKVSN